MGASFKSPLAQLAAGIVAASLYPGIYFMANNWFVYTRAQILFFIFAIPFFLLAVSIGLYGLGHVLYIKYSEQDLNQLHKTLSAVCYTFCTACVALLFHRSTVDVVGSLSFALVLEAFFLAAVFCTIFFSGTRYVNIFFYSLVAISLISWGTNYLQADNFENPTHASSHQQPIPQIEFKTTPNIYFILLESCHNKRALRDIYAYDNTPFEASLAAKGFTVFDDFFSNYTTTLTSLEATMSMQHHYYSGSIGNCDSRNARDVIGGRSYNPVLKTLKHNRYYIQYVLNSNYCFFSSDLLDYATVQRTGEIGRAFELYRKTFLNDLFNIKSVTQFDDFKNIIKPRIDFAARLKQPVFTFIKLGANHSPATWRGLPASQQRQAQQQWDQDAWKHLAYWIDRYPHILQKSDAELLELVDYILLQDHAACIVLLGDHGAHRFRNIINNDQEPNAYLRKVGVDGKLVAEDMLGVFLGIRLPRGMKMKTIPKSSINLFRALFFTLSDDRRLLDFAQDDSYISRSNGDVFTVISNGMPLEEWRLLSSMPQGR
ncbi:MAG: sulfatase-like hydrolase/transferase [Desulfovibrio sp.]